LGADVSFLVLEKLTKHFGTHLAVDGLSLGVEKGEFVSLLARRAAARPRRCR